MMKRLSIFIAVILTTSVSIADVIPTDNVDQASTASEHVMWDRVPIDFTVPVGEERMITFPDKVDFHNTNAQLTTDKVKILNNEGTLYIQAKTAFDPIRVPVVIIKTGEVVLLDISAKPNTDDKPVIVVMKSDVTQNSQAISNETSSTEPSTLNYSSLMRYAIQHLYGAERLMQDDTRINRTPMYTNKSVNLFYGTNVMSLPIASWQGGDLYVTAVLIKNVWKNKIALNLSNIKGDWLAASLFPTNYVDAVGSLHDRTTLFLISKLPFNESLNAMRGFD